VTERRGKREEKKKEKVKRGEKKKGGEGDDRRSSKSLQRYLRRLTELQRLSGTKRMTKRKKGEEKGIVLAALRIFSSSSREFRKENGGKGGRESLSEKREKEGGGREKFERVSALC